jgi:GTP-binding protein
MTQRQSPRPFPGQLEYLTSAHTLSQLPPDAGAEVAFAGRSNVGKSTALNAITGRKALARTSKTPGRTQQLIFFTIDDSHRLVDMPGYGYARVPPAIKRQWQRTMEGYFASRRSLRALVLVVDIRRLLTDFDLQMLTWCAQADMPVHVLLTKADKLSRGAAATALQSVRRSLGQRCPGASVQLFSGASRLGVDEARQRILAWLGLEDGVAGEETIQKVLE